MTKADIVNSISNKIGLEKSEIQKVVEVFMDDIKTAMAKGDNVYLRGFGTFLIKKRAAKTGRNISKNTAIKIPAHNVPAFKPSKSFIDNIKTNVKVTN